MKYSTTTIIPTVLWCCAMYVNVSIAFVQCYNFETILFKMVCLGWES